MTNKIITLTTLLNKISRQVAKRKVFLFVPAFAAVGVILIILTHAATPSVSLEAESGALSAPAIIGSDPNASPTGNGQFVQFGSATVITPPPPGTLWKPALNTSFMWLLYHPLNLASTSDMGTGVNDYLGKPAPDPVVYDIDGFDNPASTVTALHNQAKKAICYFSAGTWENWRPDQASFPDSVKGNPVSGWNGELWLDVSNLSVLGPIMQARMDMCKSKGFDAIEFDNVDGYDPQNINTSKFTVTATNQITYNKFLADEAHKRGLSAALKNDVDQVPTLAASFDFAINEQCNEFSECGNYQTYFIKNNKAVFEIEYNRTLSSFCPTMNTQNFNAYLMPINLDGGRKPCR